MNMHLEINFRLMWQPIESYNEFHASVGIECRINATDGQFQPPSVAAIHKHSLSLPRTFLCYDSNGLSTVGYLSFFFETLLMVMNQESYQAWNVTIFVMESALFSIHK